MAEGGSLPVEGHAEGGRLLLLQQLEQDGHKAVDGIGGGAVLGGEHPDAVKSPVDDGVAVNGHEFFHRMPPSRI